MCSNWNILSSMESPDFDPFQIFEVDHDSCQVLQVTVLRGDNITMGRARDMLDTPDPYVVLSVPGTNGGSQRTRCVDNCTDPVWNQEFQFLYDAETNRVLEISLVDANVVVDYVIGVSKVDIADLKLDEEAQIKVTFGENSFVHLRLRRLPNDSSDLRFSLTLCDEEKQFRRERRQRCMEAMNACFGQQAGLVSPLKIPVVAMLGSGGGFRAMIGLCGVFKALQDSGIIEMCMYLAGLSGSTWFLSQLYTDPRFPDLPTDEVIAYFRKHSGAGLLSHLGAQSMMRYMNSLVGKSVQGQPISFTDFFGMLLRDTIVENKEATLTTMRRVLERGAAPMPLFTSLHVKKNVSAKVFQEWVEFTPFEVGIPKYGAFMDAAKFGSRFFKGKIAKPFPEYPLHFLQGIWGSAFTILFKRLVRTAHGQRQALGEDAEIQNLRDLEETMDDEDIEADEVDDGCEGVIAGCTAGCDEEASTSDKKETNFWKKEKEHRDQVLTEKKTGIWEGMMQGLMASSMLNSRAGRAGAIFNPLYGLRMLNRQPLSPFTGPEEEADDEADFARMHEMMDTTTEKILLVDAGLTFNSPYPVLLRPQRGVDLYISFDFSGREDDNKDLFQELELAETWARKNKLPFPPIREQVAQFEREPLREMYIFRGNDCPTIMHFVLVNTSFRKFKAPGVPRETEEELEFGDFNIFTGGQRAFGTLNFRYDSNDFDRLSQLMEYNTKLHLDLIRAEILRAIEAKKLTSRASLKDIIRMKMLSKNKENFISLVREMQKTGASSSNGAGPSAAGSGGGSNPGPSGAGWPLAAAPPASERAAAVLERFVSAQDLLAESRSPVAAAAADPVHRLIERFASAQDLLAGADAPEAAARETPKTIPRETPESAPRETPELAPRETPEAAPRETPESAPRDTPEAARREPLEATRRERPEAAPRKTPESANVL
ncbi:cytosolic phospholipase A2-like isoform X2 [Pollicipes pollicipes]|nr:cytosolic phospholipase A2-like isoform X2 [Pollicipes pollicipes]XP_037083336.1 cytosolic phospholipase A2-like isoform X2 [Pollicipes pollicipes]